MGYIKITEDMNMVDMSEGNPGALTVLMQMMQDSNGILNILLLDSLNIRGSKIFWGAI